MIMEQLEKVIESKSCHEPTFTNDSSSYIWRNAGKVEKLFVYPLVAGIAEDVTSCFLHEIEVFGCTDSISLRNHMFVVYDERTNIVKKKSDLSNSPKITILVDDENTILLKSGDMELISLFLKDIKDGDRRTCMMPFFDKLVPDKLVKLEISDCGEMVAEWLESHTANKHLRLGYILRDVWLRKIHPHEFYKFIWDHNSYKNAMIPFEYVPSVTLLSSVSFDEVNSASSPIWLHDFCPNIIISPTSKKPFEEMKWQYIKIGDAIVSNVNLLNGSQINLENMSVDIQQRKILLSCDVLWPGSVKVGDNVYYFHIDERKKH